MKRCPRREKKHTFSVRKILAEIIPKSAAVSQAHIDAYIKLRTKLLCMEKDEVKSLILEEGNLIPQCRNIFMIIAFNLFKANSENPEKHLVKKARTVGNLGVIFLEKAVTNTSDHPIRALEREFIRFLKSDLMNLILRGSTGSEATVFAKAKAVEKARPSAVDAFESSDISTPAGAGRP